MKMLRFLDPRFALVAAVAYDPDETPEMQAACLRHAEAIAAECGFAFDEALRTIGLPRDAGEEGAVDAEPSSVHDQEDDGVGEDQEPGPLAEEDPSDPPAESGEQIAAALAADPARSDRDIARACGASPTTVGKTRVALGLERAVRTVVRRGKAYDQATGDR